MQKLLVWISSHFGLSHFALSHFALQWFYSLALAVYIALVIDGEMGINLD
jgi:hypothetical protein